MAAAQMPHLILASGSVVPRRVRPVGVSSFVRPGNCMATQYSHRRCQLPVLTNISHDRQRCFVRTYALEADTEPEAQLLEAEEADGYYLELVNELVASGNWKVVQEKVDELVEDGKMNERVLSAGLLLLQECRVRQLPQNVVSTMESVCELLTHALEKATMTPTMRLMRQLSEFNPKVPTEVAEMERMMEESFSRDVEFSEFQEDLQYFLKTMEDEEVTPIPAEAEALAAAQVQFLGQRREARERMSAILEIATTSPRVAKVVETNPGRGGGGAA